VKKQLCACLAVLVFVALGAISIGAADDVVGTWAGTWDGSGSGRFELTLERTKDGALGGKVSVTGEPTYQATLKTASFDGKKLSATYDFPPDARAEVILTGTFDAARAKGTWTVRGKDGSGELFSGGWVVRKQ
jgi:hypothetical protein